jgi:lysyl-tRNA synthetase class 2
MKNWQRLKNDPELKTKLLAREKVIDAIRAFFKTQQFHEVETPVMWVVPSAEPYLEVFETELLSPAQPPKRMYLLTSPEYALKKLIAGGLGNIFQITKAFRNHEGKSDKHNPEFTILEWYRVEADYTQLMIDCEQLLMAALGKQLTYQNKQYDLSAPFKRISVAEAFEQALGLSVNELLSLDALKKKADELGYQVDGDYESIFNQLFLNKVEPMLANELKPVILYDYPAQLPSLARKKKSDPRLVERFELYVSGLELGNAFGELIDPVEQKTRLLADLAMRKNLGKKEFPPDQDFLAALEAGLPPTAGMAIGVDRLIMLAADTTKITDTLFFPLDV